MFQDRKGEALDGHILGSLEEDRMYIRGQRGTLRMSI